MDAAGLLTGDLDDDDDDADDELLEEPEPVPVEEDEEDELDEPDELELSADLPRRRFVPCARSSLPRLPFPAPEDLPGSVSLVRR